jgi:hypothetical protein
MGVNGQGAFILFWECPTLRVILDVKTYEIFFSFFLILPGDIMEQNLKIMAL